MPITRIECEKAIAAMTPTEECHFLAHLGHQLTVVARGTYEFQGPGVIDPFALRGFNEIHHRIYSQIRTLVANGRRSIDPESMASWLAAEGRSPELQAACLWAFEQALAYVRKSA